MGSETYVFRLLPGEDLKKAIQAFVFKNNIQAGWIISCVGSLTIYNIRTANQSTPNVQQGFFEIVSLSGTFSKNGSHLHISVADESGKTFGGHLLEGNLIYTTAEIVIGTSEELIFTREKDGTTQWAELQISKQNTWRRKLFRIENLFLLVLLPYLAAISNFNYPGRFLVMDRIWAGQIFGFNFFQNTFFFIVLYLMHYILRMKDKRLPWLCSTHVLSTVFLLILLFVMADFATSVVPGWDTTIYPPLSALNDGAEYEPDARFIKIVGIAIILLQIVFAFFFIYQLIFNRNSRTTGINRA